MDEKPMNEVERVDAAAGSPQVRDGTDVPAELSIGEIEIGTAKPATMVFMGSDGRPVVTLHDGGARVELGTGVTFDDAAKCFWEAVRRCCPEMART